MTGWMVSAGLLLIYLAGSAFFSGMETGGYLLNRLRLSRRVRRGERSAQRLHYALQDAHRFIFTVLIGNNLANYLLSRDVTRLYLNSGLRDGGLLFGVIPWNAETAATLTLLLPLFIFGELLPKNWFHRHADTLMYHFSFLLLFFEKLFLPLTSLLKRLSALLAGREGDRRIFNGVSLSLQGLQEYFGGDMCGHLISAHQHGMINNLVSLRRIPIRELMTPVSEVICLPDRSTVATVLDMMRERDCEQVMLYRGGVRRIVGCVTLFDLMAPAMDSDAAAEVYMRKMPRLSSALSANRALRRLRRTPTLPAVVLDRTSKAVGVLHLKDVAAYIASGT
jgi:putative hemolysin